MGRSPARGTSTLRRLGAAASALVLVGAMLLVGWHKATVAHGVCVEHGEEIHLEKVGNAVEPGHHGVADGQGRIDATNWEQRDGDAHCQLAATHRDPYTPEHHAPQLADVVTAADAPALAPPHAPALAAVYRLAPKTSPPV